LLLVFYHHLVICTDLTILQLQTQQLMTTKLDHTWPCDIDLWPLELGVTWRGATWVVNTSAKLEVGMTLQFQS